MKRIVENNYKTHKWLSDFLRNEEQSFERGKPVLIKAGTGSGKTYWVLTVQAARARMLGLKVLLIIHRSIPKDLFRAQNEYKDCLDIRTYQSFEISKDFHTLEKYDIIICDEAHYFSSDCTFNTKTTVSWLAITNLKTNPILIFMTATGERIFDFIKEQFSETREYNFGVKYDHVEEILLYKNQEYEERIILNNLSRGTKTCVFMNDIERLGELHEMFKNSDILFSTDNKGTVLYQEMQATREYIVKNEDFPSEVLLATAIVDAGTNLKSEKITDIICSGKEIHTIIQWAGRYRSVEGSNHRIKIHIKDISKFQSTPYLKNLREHMRQVEAIERDPIKFDLDTQHEKKEEIYYFHNFDTKTYEIKPLAVAALKDQIKLYENIVMNNKAFVNELSNRFEKPITLYDELQVEIEIIKQLESKLNTKMTLDEAKQFYLNDLKIIAKRADRSIYYMVNHNKISKTIYKLGYEIIQSRTNQQRSIMIIKLKEN